MFLILMVGTILGMLALLCVLATIAYKILRTKKNLIAWFSLAIILFFIVLLVRQGLGFFNLFPSSR